MVARFLEGQKFKKKIEFKDIKEYRYSKKKIKFIFLKGLFFYLRNSKVFYELLHTKNNKLNIEMISPIYNFFWDYFLYKFFEIRYPMNSLITKNPIKRIAEIKEYRKKKKLEKKEKKEKKKLIKQKKKKKFKRINKRKFKYKKFKRFYFREKKKIKNEDILASRIIRYLKTKLENRLPFTRNILQLNNLIFKNLFMFDHFGIKPKKKKVIKKTEEMFTNFTYKICNKFFLKLLRNIYKKNYFLSYSIKGQKFHKSLFKFCFFQDQLIKKNKRYLISDDFEKGNSEKKNEILDQLDNIQFCSGLTIKFTLKRRNCFFHIWDNKSGFTLAIISAGIFGTFYKKIYKKHKQFVAFIQFFRSYFASIIMNYRQKIFSRFKYLRKVALKKLKKNFNIHSPRERIFQNNLFNKLLYLDKIIKSNKGIKKKIWKNMLLNLFFLSNFDILKSEKKHREFKYNKLILIEKNKFKFYKKKAYMYNKKKMKKYIRYNGISFLFFYRSKLSITYIIEMRKSFFQSKAMFNIRWTNLLQTLREISKLYKLNTKKKQYIFRRIFNGIRILNIYKNIKKKRKKKNLFLVRKIPRRKSYKKFKKYLLKLIKIKFKLKKLKVKNMNLIKFNYIQKFFNLKNLFRRITRNSQKN